MKKYKVLLLTLAMLSLVGCGKKKEEILPTESELVVTEANDPTEEETMMATEAPAAEVTKESEEVFEIDPAFCDTYHYEGSSIYLILSLDGTYSMVHIDGSVQSEGKWYVKEGQIYLADSSDNILSSFSESFDGGLIDQDGRALFKERIPGLSKDVSMEDFYGCWKYDDEEKWIYIYDDGVYQIFATEDELLSEDTFTVTDHACYLSEADGIVLYFTEDYEMVDASNRFLTPVQGPGASNDFYQGGGSDYAEGRLIAESLIPYMDLAGEYAGESYSINMNIYSNLEDNDVEIGNAEIFDESGNVLYSGNLGYCMDNYYELEGMHVDVTAYLDEGTICLDLFIDGEHADYLKMKSHYTS